MFCHFWVCSSKVIQLYLCVLSLFSHVRLFATPWTVACWAPLSMGFSGQEYCSRLPCPPPGDLPDPGVKPLSFICLLHWQMGGFFFFFFLPLLPPGKLIYIHAFILFQILFPFRLLMSIEQSSLYYTIGLC